jgi:protein-tyrosine kinase
MSIIEKTLEKLGAGTIAAGSHSAGETADIGKVPQQEGPAAVTGPPGGSSGDRGTGRSRMYEIDLEKLRKHGYLTPGTVNILVAEQYRRIKRPVLSNAFEDKGAHLTRRNLVMVTSAVPREGKSFTALNLALSIATELNQTALFIDADIARRMNSRFLGLADKTGLTDLLMSENSDLSEFMLKTNIPNLSILPAGTYYEKTHEMWASKRMRNLMSELSERYNDRVVIFDAPPVLLDSASQILARQAGQVVFVIEAEKTAKQVIQDALESIADAQYIGLVLNKSNRRLVSEYGYYGHVNFPPSKIRPAGTDAG